MRGASRARGVAALCAAAVCTSAAPPPIPGYVVAPLRSDWEEARVVGKRGSGAICAPAGGIAWRDVVPDPARAADRISGALNQAGITVATTDEAEDAPAAGRIVARVEALTIEACTPHFGIVRMVGGQLLKGQGELVLAWQVRGAAGSSTHTVASRFAFRGSRLALRDALLDGIAANATLFARILDARAAPPASIR